MSIDLRSDTLTKPTQQMRQVMAQAEVGDDTFKEDPTILELEEATAEALGTEAALYFPSGHMSNQAALMVHSKLGDAVIAQRRSHIFEYESGAPSALSGLFPWTIEGDEGTFTVADVEKVLQPLNIHHPRGRIVSLENTHNRCGGVIWPLQRFTEVCNFAHKQGMAVHLDGARLWNAAVASGVAEPTWCGFVDSTNVCFSKGLGAPVGSALAGSKAFIEEACFYRKVLGGQMRQGGIIAAGALYALRNNRARLADDHQHARLLAEEIGKVAGLNCKEPMTNIVVIEVVDTAINPEQVVEEVAKEGVLLFPIGGQQMRAVTNLHLRPEDCVKAAEAFGRVMQRLGS